VATDLPHIGFVGAGRVGSVLARKLADAGYPVIGVASRSGASAKMLAARIPGCQVYNSARELAGAQSLDILFLTVPDDEIATVAAEIAWPDGVGAVHCSGALGLDVLAPAFMQGGFHPLQTFAGLDAELRGVTVGIEAQGALLGTLEEMAARLGCVPLRLTPQARALYHASGAFGHNFIVTLFAQAVRLWRLIGFSEAEALQALLPLARAGLANIETGGPQKALTGPIARGDAGTVRKHLEALEASAPDLLPLYRELGLKTAELSSQGAAIECILKESRPCV
jgi:predicted short-subunit dehydrogenase-like oxidoreductase (DUF2520 family)